MTERYTGERADYDWEKLKERCMEREREQTHPCGWHPGDCAAAGSGCDACGNNPEMGI